MAEEKKSKPESKPKQLSYKEFREIFVKKPFYRICPWFCLMMKCPYFEECWGVKKGGRS